MAKPKTASWTKLLIMLGNGATPTEVFAAPCGLTSKGLDLTADTADVTVPDCDDPDAPTWQERVVRGLSGTVSGSGVMALEALPTWRTWFFAGNSKNCRVKIDMLLADNGGYFAAKFVLTKFSVTGNQDDAKISVSIEMQSDGPVTWVAASA